VSDNQLVKKQPFRFNLSLTIKLIIALTFVCSIIFFWIYTWFIDYSTNTAMHRIQDDLMDTLNGAIAGIDGDQFESMVQQNGYTAIAHQNYDTRSSGVDFPAEDQRYLEHQNWLLMIHNIEPRANPYSYVAGYEPSEILFVGDFLRYSQPENATLFLESYPEVVDMITGLSSFYYSDEIYTDDWGSWVSAYGPILNSSGKVVGGVGVDFQADYVFAVQKEIKQRILLPLSIAYLALLLLIILVSIIFTRPAVMLTRFAERISEGDYNQDFTQFEKKNWVEFTFPDEMDKLSAVFILMVDKVKQREQTLRLQVQDLQIQIDEGKRQRQVSEIVDTDFFRDLQTKAEGLRARRTRGSS
jgi:methyl-accepting chemotaxis protein